MSGPDAALPALPAELTIYTATELCQGWLASLGDLDGAVQCALDGSRVEQVDAAGLQALLSLAKTLADQGCALQLTSPSRDLERALDALGAANALREIAAASAPSRPVGKVSP